MAIEINSPNNRVAAPTIRLQGRVVRDADARLVGGTGYVGGASEIVNITTLEETISGNEKRVTKRPVLAFLGDVKVYIGPDPSYDTSNYSQRDNENDFIGQSEPNLAKNWRSDTYYTINGKDPKRTKANLYTGPFTVRRNLAGHDNVILKVKTYVRGRESEVMKSEFRIIRANLNQV